MYFSTSHPQTEVFRLAASAPKDAHEVDALVAPIRLNRDRERFAFPKIVPFLPVGMVRQALPPDEPRLLRAVFRNLLWNARVTRNLGGQRSHSAIYPRRINPTRLEDITSL